MKGAKRFFVRWIVAFALIGAAVTPTFASPVTHVQWMPRYHILCSGDGGACPCPGC